MRRRKGKERQGKEKERFEESRDQKSNGQKRVKTKKGKQEKTSDERQTGRRTMWLMLFLKAKTGTVAEDIHAVQDAPWYHGITTAYKQARIHDPHTLRVMFVRNPYARLLSGFLDKCIYPRPGYWETLIRSYGGPYEATARDFSRFVDQLNTMVGWGTWLNGHFGLHVDHCGIHDGMEYDLYLKVEEVDR
eukprot:scaffold75681_cov46-Prasinocladus_malaysianus.AAC.1